MANKQRLVVDDLGNLPEVAPAAEPRFLDSYVRPGISEIGRPAHTNPMLQLSEALGKLEPSLLRATDMAQEQFTKEEYAKGEKDFWDNREKWNALIKAGQIPEGVSPYYQRGLQRASLKQHADAFYAQAHADFYGEAGAEARQSNNPAIMQKFLQDSRTKYHQENLKNGDKDLYSPLDMHDVFNPQMEQVFGSMMKTHAAYRVGEREKEYEALATTQIETAVERNLKQIKPTDSDEMRSFYIKQAADEANAVLYDPDKGAVRNGMLPTRGSQILIDTITTKMMATGNRDYAEVLHNVKTKDGAPVGKTQYAMAKILQAEEHITNLEIRREQLARSRGKYAHEDEAAARTEKEWKERDKNKAQDATLEERAMTIFKALRHPNTALGVEMIDTVLREAEQSGDRKGAMELRSMVATLTKQRSEFEEDPQTIFKLRREMSDDPLGFDVGRIAKAVDQKLINGKTTAMSMMDDLERLRGNADHPFLKQPYFHELKTEIKGAMADKYGDTEFGEGAIRLGGAMAELRNEADMWFKDNPEGKYTDFRKYLDGIKTDLIERHNSAYGAEQKRKAEGEKKKGEAVVKESQAEQKKADDEKAKKEAPAKARQEREQKERSEVEKNNSTFKDSGRKTSEGRSILQDSEGNIATEYTTTVQDKRINWGRPTNIPTIYGGKHYTEKEARDIIAKANPDPDNIRDPETGRKLRGWYSVEDAVIAARERSNRLGKEHSTPPKPKEIPQKPAEKPKDEKAPAGTGMTTSGRFVIDEGEIIDWQTRELITMDVFNKRASDKDKQEVERLLRESVDEE